MRRWFVALWLVAAAGGAWAAPQAPFEVVKDHVDVEAAKDGSFVASRDVMLRILNARGIELLHERQIAYTQRFESVQVIAAYTLKANGQRIEVPPSGYLSGFGQSSQPGFRDNVVVSIFFPNLEVGDAVVLQTLHRQIVPWFAGHFDFRADFSRAVPAHDVAYALSAPAAMPLVFDQPGLDAVPPRTYGDKKRWTWTYRNDEALTAENDDVTESDSGPHLVISSFADYAEVARDYADRSREPASVTPEIAALADQLTQGVSDPRERTRILYDWVSTHIAYVEIVLGAGGFTPHAAKDVLANRYGDCKDHVVLLEALLKAKGIDNTAVLVRAGTSAFKLSPAATPHAFDHVITYVPAFDLYLDSTARVAPFGVLPYSDVGKPVLKVESGELAQTPTPTPLTSTIRAWSDVNLSDDGAAEATTKLTATGAMGAGLRAMMQGVLPGQENQLLREMLAPGTEGTLEKGDPLLLTEPYVVTAKYRVPGAITVPGPGAVPHGMVFKPFSFTMLLGGGMPAKRDSDYVCPSVLAEQDTRITFPAGYRLLSIPDSATITTEDVSLRLDFERTSPRSVTESIMLRIAHPKATCTPDYYRRVRPELEKMANRLREQIIYRGPKEGSE